METSKERILLLEAADILEQKGWTRGKYTTSDGLHCVVGAIQLAGKRKKMPTKSAMEYLRQFTGEQSLTFWNDCKVKSVKEIIRVLRTAGTHEKE